MTLPLAKLGGYAPRWIEVFEALGIRFVTMRSNSSAQYCVPVQAAAEATTYLSRHNPKDRVPETVTITVNHLTVPAIAAQVSPLMEKLYKLLGVQTVTLLHADRAFTVLLTEVAAVAAFLDTDPTMDALILYLSQCVKTTFPITIPLRAKEYLEGRLDEDTETLYSLFGINYALCERASIPRTAYSVLVYANMDITMRKLGTII